MIISNKEFCNAWQNSNNIVNEIFDLNNVTITDNAEFDIYSDYSDTFSGDRELLEDFKKFGGKVDESRDIMYLPAGLNVKIVKSTDRHTIFNFSRNGVDIPWLTYDNDVDCSFDIELTKIGELCFKALKEKFVSVSLANIDEVYGDILLYAKIFGIHLDL